MNEKYNLLEILEDCDYYISPSGGKHKRVLCKCDCGNEIIVLREHVVSGRQKSCGCLKKRNGKVTHGMTGTKIYRVWANMISRCCNQKLKSWDNYGGRGITVCDEWRNFQNFMDWSFKNGYSETLTLDRIDNDKGYSAENCRWVDEFVQANNKRNNHIVEYNGERLSIKQWSDKTGIPYKTLHRRIVALHWDIERAINTNVKR